MAVDESLLVAGVYPFTSQTGKPGEKWQSVNGYTPAASKLPPQPFVLGAIAVSPVLACS